MDDHELDAHPDHDDVGSRIDPVLARSWLLVNGAQYERFTPAVRSRADIVVLDIEDAVAPKDKDVARDNVIRWLNEGNTDWVRVNGFGTPWWADDLDALAKTSVGGVMLAMVESVDHVTETANRLPNVPIVALVEAARGLERITAIAEAKGTFRLAFGIGDFRRDTGFGESPTTLAYARSRFTIAAKAAHLPSAIDGPTVGSGALKLIEATAVSVEFGMTGKICLTPEQCATVATKGSLLRQTKSLGPRSFSLSSSVTAVRSATARTYPASPGPTRSSTWPAHTASRCPSSTTSTIQRISRRRRTRTTTSSVAAPVQQHLQSTATALARRECLRRWSRQSSR